jgi:hypothetical protein
MCHTILNDPILLRALFQLEDQLAEQTQSCGCSLCGCTLDKASYARKPLGVPGSIPPHLSPNRRISFCCRECRKRHTPASVIFLSRRRYLGAVIVLACALSQGLTSTRGQYLEAMGIPRQSLHRWLTWWRQEFIRTPTWQMLRTHFTNVNQIPLDPLMSVQRSTLSEKLLLWLNHIKSLSVSSSMLLRVGKITQNT